jgi:hypothetical protein
LLFSHYLELGFWFLGFVLPPFDSLCRLPVK